MASPKLDSLPAEVASQICEVLSGGHPAKVRHFALVNKFCHNAACPVLYRTIMLAPNSPRIADHVEHCKKTLERHNAMRHVRRMILTHKPVSNHFSHEWRWDPERNDDYDLRHLRYPSLGPNRSEMFDTNKVVRLPDEHCRSLAELVTLLPGLADVYCLFHGLQFPIRLLRALEEKPKFCRLHHHTLTFPGLSKPELSADQVALARSPNLHSVGIAYGEADGYDEYGRPSYRTDAISSMMKEEWLAPNLQEVRLYQIHTSESIIRAVFGAQLPPRPPWRGFTAGGEVADDCSGSCSTRSRKKQALRLLEIEGYEPHHDRTGGGSIRHRVIKAQSMKFWMVSVDFGQLRVLRLGQLVSSAALTSLVGCLGFPFMTHLRFACDESPGVEYYQTVKRFICRLPLLVNLEMFGWDFATSTLADALSPKLTNLYLLPELEVPSPGVPDGEEITGIVQRCQKLVELTIPLRRSRGDADEVAKYMTLGTLPCLSRLCLYWDVSLPSPLRTGSDGAIDSTVEPHFDDFDKEYAVDQHASELDSPWNYRNGHLRDLLLNKAIDEKLALAVFRAVSSGKGQESAPLQQLETSTMSPSYIPDAPPAYQAFLYRGAVLSSMGPGYVQVSRNKKEGHRRELNVSRVRIEGREHHATGLNGNPFMVNFRRLWPEKDGSAGWWTDWESKPLAGYEDRWGKPWPEWTVMEEELPMRGSD